MEEKLIALVQGVPCKVGDTVYIICNYGNGAAIHKAVVSSIECVLGLNDEPTWRITFRETTENKTIFHHRVGFDDFGKMVFLSESEAKSAASKVLKVREV